METKGETDPSKRSSTGPLAREAFTRVPKSAVLFPPDSAPQAQAGMPFLTSRVRDEVVVKGGGVVEVHRRFFLGINGTYG